MQFRLNFRPTALAAFGLLAATAAFSAGAHAADEWPTRDITFVPYAPGGCTDPISRKYAELLEKQLKVKVIVENKPGASATIGTGAVIRAAPDGYTIGLGSTSVTRSIHNASETRPLVLRRIAYFDTNGKMVENYLKAPVAPEPFSTVEVFVPTTDVRGGTGANFVVDWAAVGEIAEPVVEALMFGGLGGGYYAFISQGRPLKVVGKD